MKAENLDEVSKLIRHLERVQRDLESLNEGESAIVTIRGEKWYVESDIDVDDAVALVRLDREIMIEEITGELLHLGVEISK